MLNKMVIGKFSSHYSKLHFLNPLVKISCVLLFIIIIFLSDDLYFISFMTIFTLIIMAISNIPFLTYFKFIWSLKILLLFIIIINLLFKVNPFIISLMVIRLILIVLYTQILTLTTKPLDLTKGLKQLFKPLQLIKIPINKMAFIISMSLRFLPILIEQVNKIMKAQLVRGVDFKKLTLKDKIIGLKAIILPMIIYSFKRADELASSMELRLYDINKDRTNTKAFKFNFNDVNMLIIHVSILMLVIIVGG